MPRAIHHAKQAIVTILFLAAALGALTPSYLHLADWWKEWMPEGWQHLAYLAALVAEGVIIACGITRATLVRPDDDGYDTVHRLEWGGVAMSIYVNARWGAAHATGEGVWWWTDILAGSVALPLFAYWVLEAYGVALRRLGPAPRVAKQRQQTSTTAANGTTTPTLTIATGNVKATTAPAPTGVMATDAAVAASAGVAPRTARDWRTKGDPRYDQHRPPATGSQPVMSGHGA